MIDNSRLLKRYSAVEGGFSFLIAVLSFMVLSVIFSLIANGAGIESGSTAFVVLNFFSGLSVQVCFLVAAFLPSKVLHSRPSYTPKKVSLRACLIALLITVICVIGFEGLALAFNATLIGSGYVDASAAVQFSGVMIALMAVRAVFVAPICEEALFRGSVLSSLEVTGSMHEKRRVAFMILICGLLFSLMHMSPLQTVYQFFIGCTLAYVTIRFGSIIPAIIIHAANNLIGVILSLPVIDGAVSGFLLSIFGTGWFALFIGVSVVLAIAAAVAIRAICRKFGGMSPQSPDKENLKEDGTFINSADDGGTLASAVLYGAGAIICIIMWVSMLASGFAAV